MNKTKCVYPWIEMLAQTGGDWNMCCISASAGKILKEDGSTYRAAHDSMESARTSPWMDQVRQDMLDGKEISACKHCYYQESIGKKSYREMFNQEWTDKLGIDEIERLTETNKVIEGVQYLDLRLGNLCNLKCRMCHSFNSTMIGDEAKELLKEDESFKDIYGRYISRSEPADKFEWFESDHFWHDVIDKIPNLRKIYMTGGEPTLIEGNYRFIDECVRSGHSKHITLMFNINCTNIQQRFIDQLEHFEFVILNCSIDAYGELNDYIRTNSRWKAISKNFEKLLKLPKNVQLGVTPVIQTYNVGQIVDLVQWVENHAIANDRSINVDFLYATHPAMLNASVLPRSYREMAAKRLDNFKQNSHIYKTNSFAKNGIDSCINLLNKNTNEDQTQIVKDFINYTRILDLKRNQFLDQYNPELAEAINYER
ncbi:MAG: twitch domain-containing radical SAM protein [Candidimonas sp.]